MQQPERRLGSPEPRSKSPQRPPSSLVSNKAVSALTVTTVPLKSSPLSRTEGLMRAQHRNSSVENFLSLVHSGDIPAPDDDLLSLPILQQLVGGHAPNADRRRAPATKADAAAAADAGPPIKRGADAPITEFEPLKKQARA